ncbi:hypothetical protein JAAARDRAFT_135397, partial [Jaapia argillacea MUCL 33604]
MFSDISHEELSKITTKFLPEALQYASRFWAHHLSSVSPDASQLLTQIDIFLHSHLILWIEVMSILHKLDEAVRSLLEKSAPQDLKLHSMTMDAVCFIRAFFTPLSSGPLQLYTSALPFLPSKSSIHHTYGHLVDKTAPFVLHGRESTWSPLLLSLESHTGKNKYVTEPITALAFSNDGTHLASGGHYGNIQIWSLETGGIISSTIKANGPGISSVAFSPDGLRVASCDEVGSIRIWETLFQPCQSHPLKNSSSSIIVATFSFDGSRLATESQGGVVHLWDTASGKL